MQIRVEDAIFRDPRHGWIVANDRAAGRARVYRTADGGRTWRSAAVASTNCAAGSRLEHSAAGSNDAWLTTWNGVRGSRSLYATNDGGRIWHRLALPAA
jgi:photosystem II stability/assembly factor-like uncharacterized protein